MSAASSSSVSAAQRGASSSKRSLPEPSLAEFATDVIKRAASDAERPAVVCSNAGASTEQALAIPPPDGQFAVSVKRCAAWLQPDSIPRFEVAYPGPKWHPMTEQISKEMYTAFLANTPGQYTEPLTANGKGGKREYIVDWQQMIQTNIDNGRQRSVRFHPHEADDTNQHHGRILTGKMR